jgi:cellulose synthase/poly-beta-1,6-N-acetylglucosamine synthase-like glycosyltransferase
MGPAENALIILYLLCLCIQLIYHWGIFRQLAFANLPVSNTQPTQPVSVIIAAQNEEANLPRLLKALQQQNHPDFEVIVVNDRSTDGTATLLADFKRQFHALKVITISTLPSGWSGKKHAIQKGVEAASHEILLFTDADCYPVSHSWIKAMTGAFDQNTEIALGFSPYARTPGILNQFIRFETLHTALLYLSYALSGRPYMGVGRNLAYRKRLFEKAGFGNDKEYVGGDDDIFVNRHATKDNCRVVISPDSQMISVAKSSWLTYLKQKIRHLSAGKRYHQKDQTSLGIFSLCSLVGWILFVYLALAMENKTLILAPFAVRSLSFYSIFTLSGQKLKVKLSYWALPLLDLCYTIYYPVVGLIALTAKRIKWS